MSLINTCCAFTIILASFFAFRGNAQTILNGDFENNSADTCTYNLENELFNLIMEDVVAFGSNSEIDIHDYSCGFADLISNNWFVSLSQRPSGQTDQLSLRLDSPLTVGASYRLTYFDWAETSGLNNIPLPLEIGLSTDSMSFGALIHTSMPVEYEWTQQSVEFTATFAATYITVQMAGDFGLKGWTFVDAFELSPLTNLTEAATSSINVYPNPTTDRIFVTTDFRVESIRLFNAVGQLLQSHQPATSSPYQLNLHNFPAGVYFVEISNGQSRMVKRVEKW